jgi:hypothetical protein
MTKCDFCEFGNYNFCNQIYYTVARETACRKASEKMQEFIIKNQIPIGIKEEK